MTRPQRIRLDDTAAVYVILVVVIAGAALLSASRGLNLFSAGNIDVILTSITVLGLVAVGQTHAVLVGSLDLSVGYVMSLASVLCAGLMAGSDANVPQAVAISLGVCVVLGVVNGFLVGVLELNGFIVTLGTGLVISGYLATHYPGTVSGVPASVARLGQAKLGFVPVTTLLMVVVLLLAHLVLTRTRVGYHLFAVGGNAEVSRATGVSPPASVVFGHVVSALCAGLAGLVIVARLGVGSPVIGEQGAFGLLSIAAVVLGGCSLAGGRGSLLGTIAGILIFAVLDSTLSILQVNPYVKDIVRGAVIVAAVAAFALRRDVQHFVRFPASASTATTAERSAL